MVKFRSAAALPFAPPAPKWKAALLNTGKTAAVLALAVLLSELLHRLQLGAQNVTMVYILCSVIISRITPGYVYGIAATLAGAFLCDFLITAPRLAFSFTVGFPITLCIMLLVTLVSCAVTTQMKTQAALALERKQRAELLYEINQKLLATQQMGAIIRIACEYLNRYIRRSVVFYTQDPLHDLCPVPSLLRESDRPLLLSDDERKTAHARYAQLQSTAPLQELLERPVYYEPVVSAECMHGLIGICCTQRPLNTGEVAFVQMLAGQMALAMELRRLADRQYRIQLETEREKMRATLLRAISHDLRTPLTSILGASATILEQQAAMPSATRHALVLDIRENAQWLIRMVENLLAVTRITGETMALKKEPEAVEEVVAQAVAVVRSRFPDRLIHVTTPEELLLVPMDATLISQVVINLLENAAKNAPSGSLVLLDVLREGEAAVFHVIDNGPGIPEELLGGLFDGHCPTQGKTADSVRGMGIGLSICQTIVQAHGGTITGCNRKGGGARFTFWLPL